MQDTLVLNQAFIQPLPFLQNFHTTVDVLRLDVLHPVISGNKWFKLKRYIEEARVQNKKALLTFGGAFSNHIAATAAACASYGLGSIGIIRGEPGTTPSHTLTAAAELGMNLYFVDRATYRAKQIPCEVYARFSDADLLIVNEGGYGKPGCRGAADILSVCDTSAYTHIFAACGTGTTLAGLIEGSQHHQQVCGVSVLKNHDGLENDLRPLLQEKTKPFALYHDYHFGGYAKHKPELFRFMNELYRSCAIPTDFVYTAKLFFALQDIISHGGLPTGSKVLVIHSGGLQGNGSLPQGTLIF